MTTTTKSRGANADRYLELVQELPLRPLKNKTDYRRAAAMLDSLASRIEGSLSEGEQDYLETLTLLVEAFDSKQEPIAAHLDPIDALKSLMEAHEMNTTDLGRLLGSKGIASEVLNGKRELSKTHIGVLAERFNVDVSLFFPGK